MSKRAHRREEKNSTRVILPVRYTDEQFKAALAEFNSRVEDCGIFEDMARKERYIKRTQLGKKDARERSKSRNAALKERNELEQKYYRMSVTK